MTRYLLLTLLLMGQSPSEATVNKLAGKYIDPAYLTGFNYQSHWIYPCRAWQTTQPANIFLNGIGVNATFGPMPSIDLVYHMLAKYGFKRVRIEVGWGQLDYATGSTVNANTIAQLQACAKYGLRPLILLNSNQGVPCPNVGFNRTVMVATAAGSTTVTLNDTSGLIVGKSGFSYLTGFTMCEVLITAINGNTVTLSKPLPGTGFPAGYSATMHTLKYVPFDAPDGYAYNSADQAATMAGWQSYVMTIGNIATGYLGAGNFDMEIWNELSFGSQFLQLPSYYGQPLPADWFSSLPIASVTASTLTAHPSVFNGVTLEDGFGNQTPFGAPVFDPIRVGAIGRHFYPPVLSYPDNQQRIWGMVNALLQVESTYPFVPTYGPIYMPEYGGTVLQTETLARDLCPFDNYVYNTVHGVNSRVVNGVVYPCPLFLSEIGMQPSSIGVTDSTQAELFKAKGDSRILTFYLNKGAASVWLYSATGNGDWDWEVVSDSFIQYAMTNSVYPADDSPYVSPLLKILSRMVGQMQNGLDPTLTKTRHITVSSISDTHNHYQFAGDGTNAHPNGYDREAFQFLPFQINAHRFVIPYYVMTRNLAQPLIPEKFTLKLGGIHGSRATITAYDPLNDAVVPVTVKNAGVNAVTLIVTAADYPYLLIIQET